MSKSALKRLVLLTCLLVLPQLLVAQMTPEQSAAFQTANSGNAAFGTASLLLLIRGALTVLLIIWFVWVVQGAYRAWAGGSEESMGSGSQVLRALFIMLVFLTAIYW